MGYLVTAASFLFLSPVKIKATLKNAHGPYVLSALFSCLPASNTGGNLVRALNEQHDLTLTLADSICGFVSVNYFSHR